MESVRPWVYMERKERPNSPYVPDEPVSQPAICDKALDMYWCHLGYSNPRCWLTANRWDSTYHQRNHPAVHHQLTESGKITKQLFNYSMLSGLLHSNMDNWNTIYPETWKSAFHFSPSSSTSSSQSLWLYLLDISWKYFLSFHMLLPSPDYHLSLL